MNHKTIKTEVKAHICIVSSKFLVTERPYVSPSCVHFVYRRTSENPILVDMTDRNCVCNEKLIKNDHTLLI